MAFLFCAQATKSQPGTFDSLRNIIRTATSDSARIGAYLLWGELHFNNNPDSSFQLWKTARQLATISVARTQRSRISVRQLAASINNIGVYMNLIGENDSALIYLRASLKLDKETKNMTSYTETLFSLGGISFLNDNLPEALKQFKECYYLYKGAGDESGMAKSTVNMALVYQNQGLIQKALESYQNALSIHQRMNDSSNIANVEMNIASLYFSQNDYTKSLEYTGRALNYFKKERDLRSVGSALHNLAVMNHKLKNWRAADSLYRKSLLVREEIGDKKGIAGCLKGLGIIAYELKRFPEAHKAFEESIRIFQAVNNPIGEALVLSEMGQLYLIQKQYLQAEKYCKRAIEITTRLGFPEYSAKCASQLFQIYKALGRHKEALEQMELHIQLRDSLNNESIRKASVKSQLKYEYEKQAAADSVAHAKESEIKNAEIAKQTAEIKAKKNQQYALFGGLGLVVIFAGFMYNRFKITQKQKAIIEAQKQVVEEQKKIVEEKQKEILDSIHYARRIQMAQIPSERRVKNILNNLKKI